MILQDNTTKTCGQCCLAEILGITLEESILLIGHDRGTTSKQLTQHFNSAPNKRGIPSVYALCKLRWKKDNGDMEPNWHWILHKDGQIYDPGLGQYLRIDGYFNAVDARITSYFEIHETQKD